MSGIWYGSRSQQHDLNGKPLPGARAYFTLGGTTTPIVVYQDSGLTVPHSNPVLADGFGRFPVVYLDEADGFYNVRVQTKAGVNLYSDVGIPIIGPTEGGGGGGGGTPVDPNALYKTGDIKIAFFSGVLTGFVRANGRTIGTSISGASELANSDAEQLYYHCWNNATDTVCPVIGGRGASAAADWSANKPLTLPNARGAAIIGLDNMGNTAAGRVAAATSLGWFGGAENHTLTIEQMPSHDHQLSQEPHQHGWGNSAQPFTVDATGNFGGFTQGGPNPTGLKTEFATIDISMAARGGGLPHNNLQPSFAVSIYLKL